MQRMNARSKKELMATQKKWERGARERKRIVKMS